MVLIEELENDFPSAADPLDIEPEGELRVEPEPEPDGFGRPMPQTATATAGFSQKTKTVAPPAVHVCLECETFYPDGDGWDYCPNCSANVFEVDRA